MIARFLIVGMLLLAGAQSYAQERNTEAPFGLIWASSSADINRLGVELREAPFGDFGASFSATKLPKALADVDTVILSFGNDDKLWRIAAVSRSFSNDPYGSAVKARYQELVNVLSEKYGQGRSYHHQDTELWKAPSEFVMGIRNGRTHWFTQYEAPTATIELAIVSSGFDGASWRIIFENKEMRAQFEKSKKSREKGTL